MTISTTINKVCRVLLIGALLLLARQTASAQRTISRQLATYAISYYTGTSVGAEAFCQQYTLDGYWEAGVTVSPYMYPLSTGDILCDMHLAAAGGYLWRLAATRSRSINWYAGAGAFAGVEWCDPFEQLPEYVRLGVADIGFLYGVYAKTTVELFVASRFALVIQGAVPINFSSFTGPFHWHAGVGVKFMLN